MRHERRESRNEHRDSRLAFENLRGKLELDTRRMGESVACNSCILTEIVGSADKQEREKDNKRT